MRTLLCIVCLLLSMVGVANAADIRRTTDGALISGPIVPGDYRRLTEFLLNTENYAAFTWQLRLNSPGGDVAEALKMARLIDRVFAMTVVTATSRCSSSCFLLWSAGVARVNAGTLGVHRLRLTNQTVDLRATEVALAPASIEVESFLAKMGIPARVIEKMRETPPRDLFVLSDDWLEKQGLWEVIQYRPAFLDIVESQCGPEPFNAAMRSNRRTDTEATNKWQKCAWLARYKNQSQHFGEIQDLIEAMSNKR